jgi:hypothetical protein
MVFEWKHRTRWTLCGRPYFPLVVCDDVHKFECTLVHTHAGAALQWDRGIGEHRRRAKAWGAWQLLARRAANVLPPKPRVERSAPREEVDLGARLLRVRPRGRWHEAQASVATRATRGDRAPLSAPPQGGKRLSKAEFEALLDGLAHEDPQIVKRFGPGENEGPLPEDGRRRLLAEQQTMVRDRNLAVFELLTGIQADFARRGLSANLWQHWVGEWTELLYSLGAHDSDEDLIEVGALHVVRKLLLGGEASLEDRRELGRDSPILRRLLDSYGGLTFPAFFMRTLHHLYLLALLARGATGFEVNGRLGWVHLAIDPFERAVVLLAEGRARPPSVEERQRLDEAQGLANELLSGVERLEPSAEQWEGMSNHERSLLRERLGRDKEGAGLHPLPSGHSFWAEQDTLACYSLPGWEQKRGLPHYSSFEHPDGRSKSSEEFKCATGKTVTQWDAKNVVGLVKAAGKLSGKKGNASKQPNRSRGVFVFCCPHRVIYGFHTMLRGESPRDPFTVLGRLRRENLPEILVYDNACALRNYCLRRAPGHFAKVRFVVDR